MKKNNKEFIPKKIKYEFKNSKVDKVWTFFSIFFFTYLGVILYMNENEFSYVLFLIVAITAIGNRNIFSNKPEIIIDQKGIWTKNHGHTDWSKIERIDLKINRIMRYGIFRFFPRFSLNEELIIYLKDNVFMKKRNYIEISGISNAKFLDKLIKYYTRNKEI